MALFTIESDFRYEIVRKIFEGGMGIVYEAEQHGAREFVKRVAIKVIRPNFGSQKMFIENFIGEAKLVANLIHTNIVQTYHLGETNGVAFIAMELIRGVNLEQFTHQLADKKRQLPKELAVFITSRIARGLAYAHAKTDKDGRPLGIVHRDVSLKNIMIAFEGDVKVTDFGIAKARGFSDRPGRRSRRRQGRLHESRTGGFPDHRQTFRLVFRRRGACAFAAGTEYFQGRDRRRIARTDFEPGHSRFPPA